MSKTNMKTTAKKTTKNPFDAVVKGLETKSAKIRALNAKGASRSEIAAYLGIRYQHVRNVLVTPLKRPAS